MRHINDYKVLNALTIKSLEEDVKKHLEDGWEPIGGIAIEKFVYHQAITLNQYIQ